jgi:hypothetical protein
MSKKDLDWFKVNFRPHFDSWITEKIRPLTSNDYALESFILISCAIDWLSSLRSGGRTSGEKYIQFLIDYFPNTYDPEGIYDSLRNGLVHMFTIKHMKYTLTKNDPEKHLTVSEVTHQIVLNAGSFFKDWENAKNSYFDDVEMNPDLLDLLMARINHYGFLFPIENC